MDSGSVSVNWVQLFHHVMNGIEIFIIVFGILLIKLRKNIGAFKQIIIIIIIRVKISVFSKKKTFSIEIRCSKRTFRVCVQLFLEHCRSFCLHRNTMKPLHFFQIIFVHAHRISFYHRRFISLFLFCSSNKVDLFQFYWIALFQRPDQLSRALCFDNEKGNPINIDQNAQQIEKSEFFVVGIFVVLKL